MSVDCGEDRPVASDAYALSWVKTGSELANNDVASLDQLSITALYASVLSA
jgi:hypothetical protein